MAATTKDEPLALDDARRVGPRDALTGDYDPDVDYVPDLVEKGYHAGTVRQPADLRPARSADAPAARLVDPNTGATYVLESTTDLPSKFTEDPGALKRLKEAHNRIESTAAWQRSVRRPEPPATASREEALAFANAESSGASSTRRSDADRPKAAPKAKGSGKAAVTTSSADADTAKVDDDVTGNPDNQGKGSPPDGGND